MSEPTGPPNAGSPFEMPQFPDPIDPDAPGRGPLIMGVTWTMTILCILIITARFYVRATVARKVSLDDWFMLAAVVSFFGDILLAPFALHGIFANRLCPQTGHANRLPGMPHRSVSLGPGQAGRQLVGLSSTDPGPQVELDLDHTSHPGLHSGEDLGQHSVDTAVWIQGLALVVPLAVYGFTSRRLQRARRLCLGAG